MDAGLFSAAWGRPVTESAFRCGVYLPPFGPCGDPAVLVDLAVRAEVAGWDGVFLWDHLVHEAMPIVDPWTALGAIAHATHRALGPHRQAKPLEDHPVTSSGSHGYGVGLASRRDGEASARSTGAGGEKTRGWVTTRRMPLCTRSETPIGSSDPAAALSQAR
jgi:hypothetical protein